MLVEPVAPMGSHGLHVIPVALAFLVGLRGERRLLRTLLCLATWGEELAGQCLFSNPF